MEDWIGKAIDRALKVLHRRRLERWLKEIRPLETRDYLKRYNLLSTMLVGRKITVVNMKGDPSPRPYLPILKRLSHHSLLQDYGFAWTDGETIFLPVNIAETPAEEDGLELLKILIFFISSQLRWSTLAFASSRRYLLMENRLLADIFWIVENTRLTSIIFREFPGIKDVYANLVNLLTLRRPDIKKLREPEQRVESFLRMSISLEGHESINSKDPAQSLKISEGILSAWSKKGLSFKGYRGMIPFPLWGRFIPERLKGYIASTHIKDDNKSLEPHEDWAKTDQGNGEHHFLARKEEIDEEANENGLMLTIGEKIISWTEFVNVSRPFDDNLEDDRKTRADSMDELTIGHVSRRVKAIFNANLIRHESPEERDNTCEDGAYLSYPEWDYCKKGYRYDYVRVKESTVKDDSREWADRVISKRRFMIRHIIGRFQAINHKKGLIGRLIDGDLLDIDSTVEGLIDLKASIQPDEKWFSTYKRVERDISILFLIDLSMSTDVWVGEKRIIDHEKEALVILCEVLSILGDRFAIYGFSGKTRKRCTLYKVKGFNEIYSDHIKGRISGLIPYHYTRIGAAIRHSTSILRKEDSHTKMLFLISDGKPNDMDRYEGRYGIEDTRIAIKELEREGIIPFCLTVDSKAHDYIPYLFGKCNYAIVKEAIRLPHAMVRLYERMIRNL